MSDWPDDISKEAWSVGCETWEKLEREHPAFDAEVAVIARAIDQARREGYAAGVRAAAEVADAEFVKWQTRQESSVRNRADRTEIAVHGAAKDVAAGVAAQIRALDGKGNWV